MPDQRGLRARRGGHIPEPPTPGLRDALIQQEGQGYGSRDKVHSILVSEFIILF